MYKQKLDISVLIYVLAWQYFRSILGSWLVR